jgi:hypothetical protein
MATVSTHEQMSDAARVAKDAANAALGRRKDSAAETLHSLAGALRRAAGEADADGQHAMVTWAADGLERAASTLRDKDLGGMLREAENFGRAQPVAFFFAAAAAGFLAARFIKAGTGSQLGEPSASPTHDDPAVGL